MATFKSFAELATAVETTRYNDLLQAEYAAWESKRVQLNAEAKAKADAAAEKKLCKQKRLAERKAAKAATANFWDLI